ncbi:hypothetical protein V6N13_077021 [Hibiscus sabdariffa]
MRSTYGRLVHWTARGLVFSSQSCLQLNYIVHTFDFEAAHWSYKATPRASEQNSSALSIYLGLEEDRLEKEVGMEELLL